MSREASEPNLDEIIKEAEEVLAHRNDHDYWRSKTPDERLRAVYVLNVLKWGEVYLRGRVDRTRLQVVSMDRYEEQQ